MSAVYLSGLLVDFTGAEVRLCNKHVDTFNNRIASSLKDKYTSSYQVYARLCGTCNGEGGISTSEACIHKSYQPHYYET